MKTFKLSIALIIGLLFVCFFSCKQSESKPNEKKIGQAKQASLPSVGHTNAASAVQIYSGEVSVNLNGVDYAFHSMLGMSILEDELAFPKRTREEIINGENRNAKGTPTGKRTISMTFFRKDSAQYLVSLYAYFDGQLGEKQTLTPTMLHTFGWSGNDVFVGKSLTKMAGAAANYCGYKESTINFTKIEKKEGSKSLVSGTFEIAFDCAKYKYRFTKGTFKDVIVDDFNISMPSITEDRQRLMH